MSGALPSLDLSGRRVLVTGGSRGIGRAIAESLAAAGAAVVVHAAAEHADEAHALAGSLPRANAIAADLGTPGSGRALAAAAEALGPLDILVLSAAVEIRARWDLADPADIDLQLAVNLRETLGLLQAVVPGMAARGWGRVLALGSVQSVRPHPEMIVYAATKSALVSMIRNIAKQVAAAGVTANVLSPGAIETQRNAAALAAPEYRAAVLRAIPAGRLGRPADCAGLALFLCSDASAYVTGAEMRVDGGMSL